MDKKRILVVMAHPDDESFGPSGTLARYAAQGVEIHLLCVTNGEASEVAIAEKESLSMTERQQRLIQIRQQELQNAAQVIGISQIDFLNFPDGQLCNAFYHAIADKIIYKMNYFMPQIVITTEPQGISGHLDHIAVSMITTYAFMKSLFGNKLYYVCLPKDIVQMTQHRDYFVYFPAGYEQSAITTRIDFSDYVNKKIAAIHQHVSQQADANYLLKLFEAIPKIDFFILHQHRHCQIQLPEDDLFAGIA